MGAIAAVLLYFHRDICADRRRLVPGTAPAGVPRPLRPPVRAGTSSSARSRSASSASSARTSSAGRCARCGGSGVSLVVWSGVMVYAESVGRQDRHERDLNMTDSIVVGAAPVRRPGPRCLAVRRHHLRWSDPQPRPRDRDPAELLPVDPRADRGRALRAQGRRRQRHRRRADPGRHRRQLRRGVRRRSPGCCGSWPDTRSRGSCPTDSWSASP